MALDLVRGWHLGDVHRDLATPWKGQGAQCPDALMISKNHDCNIWVSIFSRGPRYVLVGGGALAMHTPEAYPEAYPRSIPRSKPPK